MRVYSSLECKLCENIYQTWQYLWRKFTHIYLSSAAFPPPINFDTGLSTHIRPCRSIFCLLCVLTSMFKKYESRWCEKKGKKNICPMDVHIDRKKIDWKLKLISLEICMLYEIFFLTCQRVRYCAKFKQKYTTQ